MTLLDSTAVDASDGALGFPEGVFESVGDSVFVLAADQPSGQGRDLDLLVVGSRGHGPAGSVLLGSVSSRLIIAAACPVMVVRGPRGS
jgi:nucleotide-binding universal stress UspA family protein